MYTTDQKVEAVVNQLIALAKQCQKEGDRFKEYVPYIAGFWVSAKYVNSDLYCISISCYDENNQMLSRTVWTATIEDVPVIVTKESIKSVLLEGALTAQSIATSAMKNAMRF